MAHKFRIQVGAKKFKNLPANSDFCRRCISPIAFVKFLPFDVRMMWSFQYLRGTVGGALLFDSFSITFPMPKKARKRRYEIKDE